MTVKREVEGRTVDLVGVVSGQSISGTGPYVRLEIWKSIPLKLSVPAFSVESLHVFPGVCVFQCPVTWGEQIMGQRLRENSLDSELGSTLWLCHVGKYQCLWTGFLTYEMKLLSSQGCREDWKHRSCRAHLRIPQRHPIHGSRHCYHHYYWDLLF